MADMKNRTPFYGAVPTSKLNADHVFMADGSTLQEQADKKFELIEEITLTEDTTIIERTTEPDGTNYNFKALYIEVSNPINATAGHANIVLNNSFTTLMQNVATTNGTAYTSILFNDIYGLLYIIDKPATTSATANVGGLVRQSLIFDTIINQVKMAITSSGSYFMTDAVIKIYAVRA